MLAEETIAIPPTDGVVQLSTQSDATPILSPNEDGITTSNPEDNTSTPPLSDDAKIPLASSPPSHSSNQR